MPPSDVWLMIEAQEEEVQRQWEMTRAIAYNIGKFGNSDPKKFPKKIQSFWPFPWDTQAPATNAQEILRQHALNKARREQLENAKNLNP